MDQLHRIMDTESHHRNQGVTGDFQEEILENDDSPYETIDTHIKIELEDDYGYSTLQNTSTLHKAIVTNVEEVNQLVKIEKVDNAQEEILENDESRYETIDTHIKIELDDDYAYSTLQNTSTLHQAIDSNVDDINQLVKNEKIDCVQEEILENDESRYETIDTHIKIELDDEYSYSTPQNTSTLHQAIDTEVHDINQLVKIEKAEHIENSNFSENTINFHGTGSRNIKQELAVDKERLDNLHPQLREKSNIYIFENCPTKDNIGEDMLVEIINIKQEMKDTEEKVLKDYSHSYAKYNSTFEDTDVQNERSDTTGNNDLYLESDKVYVEENGPYARFGNLNPVNGFTSDGKRDLKLDNRSDSFLDTADRTTAAFKPMNETLGRFNTGDRSSVLVNVNSKNDDNVFNTDNSDIKSVSNLNIAKCVSGAETMEIKTSTIDSNTDPGIRTRNLVDIQHTVSLSSQRGECTTLNSGAQAHTATQNVFHHPNNSPSIRQVEEHTSSCNGNGNNSGKLAEQVNTKPDKGLKDFILLWKDQLVNVNGHPLKCIMCEKEVRTLNALIEHVCICPHNKMKVDRPPQCSVCCKDFKSLADLRKHIIRHSRDRTHQCSVCVKDFKCFADLRKHVIRHSRERTHHCNVCGKNFKTFYEVKTHMISHSTDRPHQCNVCDKEFKILKDLKQHLICHSTERPHQCNVCEKYFKRPHYLKQHMLNHSNERPHQCNICCKYFKTMPALRRHQISHNTGRPHQCEVCDKEFKRLSNLRTHMFSHNTQRPYQCNVCEKDFKSPDYLKQHMISHSSVWQHTCSLCNKGFKTSRVLRNHMVRHTEGPHQYDGVDVKKTESTL